MGKEKRNGPEGPALPEGTEGNKHGGSEELKVVQQGC